jgi:hypothetical protein
MKLVQSVILCSTAVLGYHLWHVHRSSPVPPPATDSYSAEGFVKTAMPQEAQGSAVLIVAPVDCPRNAARTRSALALAQELTRLGIASTMTTHVSFRWNTRDPDARASTDRAQAVLRDGPPVVFVNGMAKSNPSADDVARVLQRTGASGS